MTDDGFTPDEERIVMALLELIVPPSPDGRLPGAGALGLSAHVARTVRQTPMLRPVVEYGLSALSALAATRDPAGFAALSTEEQTVLLRDFAAGDQFFMPAFLFLAYSGYYQHPHVQQALGLEPRPPHPQGYAMEDDDLSILAPVRARGRIYRTV